MASPLKGISTRAVKESFFVVSAGCAMKLKATWNISGRPPTITGTLKRIGSSTRILPRRYPLFALLAAARDEEQRQLAADVLEVGAHQRQRRVLDDDVARDAQRVARGRGLELAGGADAQVPQLRTLADDRDPWVDVVVEVRLRQPRLQFEGDAVGYGAVLRGDVEAVVVLHAPAVEAQRQHRVTWLRRVRARWRRRARGMPPPPDGAGGSGAA